MGLYWHNARTVLTSCSFVIAFTVPYLLNAPYANLGSKVGFIYAPLAALAFLFCVCECTPSSPP
jgi:SP family sugar:H+ symporter-like MFS transporter